ncbi:AraC family transcriptional regulator [Nostoc sp. ChiQUE01b]|uniref:helix-turn-helix domain-containing protein n=1 Tax=Nostoc sp. ChiQUE01b TaxID=3075376 RepID=UPI002AD42DB2|nr:AraC family transcriptional regulator [Nostoc sp. ChiQUE01b]MDZ8238728.1 AraC family transcriptional regulator [Nostoc sp. ChiQUE01a]MDZ8263572.1 AraC family transcriptional regulator [Nostoc sp. ChiQUE01b]
MVSSNGILEQRNFLQVTLPHIWDRDLSDVCDEQLLETLRQPLHQQSFLALERTNRALESKVQELLAELTTAKEQFCREKAADQQRQTELEKSLSLLQATLDSTEELLEAIAPQLEKHVGSKQWDLAKYQRISEPQRLFPTCSQLKKVFDYIEANYHQSIGLSNVAVAVGYSAAYLTNLVRRKTGKTVNDWIFERRMLAARALLLETDQPINQIACAIGYQYEGYFFRQFRQFYGTTPQVWRNTQRSNVSVKQ